MDSKVVLSRFVGPDEANLEASYAYQWIEPIAADYPNRSRQFFGAIATYQVFRRLGILKDSAYRLRFGDRGWDFFVGFLRDNEAYISSTAIANTYPRRRDYFAGISLKGFLWTGFDLTARPTRFTSDVIGIGLQKNSQIRTDVTALIRVLDEDREKGLPRGEQGTRVGVVHLIGGLRDDTAQTGPNSFENHKFGGGIESSFYTTANRETYFLSDRCERERFFNLGKNTDIFRATFSIGF